LIHFGYLQCFSTECIINCLRCDVSYQMCDSAVQRQERQAVTYIQCIKENTDVSGICWWWKTYHQWRGLHMSVLYLTYFDEYSSLLDLLYHHSALPSHSSVTVVWCTISVSEFLSWHLGKHSVLWTVDHTSFIICRYLTGFTLVPTLPTLGGWQGWVGLGGWLNTEKVRTRFKLVNITHCSTNRALCRITTLIETNTLPLQQTATYWIHNNK